MKTKKIALPFSHLAKFALCLSSQERCDCGDGAALHYTPDSNMKGICNLNPLNTGTPENANVYSKLFFFCGSEYRSALDCVFAVIPRVARNREKWGANTIIVCVCVCEYVWRKLRVVALFRPFFFCESLAPLLPHFLRVYYISSFAVP